MLFRWYNEGAAITEAGVNATTTPAIRFVTYAESLTGIVYANPQTQSANLTVTVYDAAGSVVGTPHNVTLPPGGHLAENIVTWLGQSFTGSVGITSDVPIVSLSLNAEVSTPAHLVVSSLPPGDLDSGKPEILAVSVEPNRGVPLCNILYYCDYIVTLKGRGFSRKAVIEVVSVNGGTLFAQYTDLPIANATTIEFLLSGASPNVIYTNGGFLITVVNPGGVRSNTIQQWSSTDHPDS